MTDSDPNAVIGENNGRLIAMGIELQIVLVSILAMIGIIGVPLTAFWLLWKKSGEAKHSREKGHHHQHG
ncbi:hypothetical protein P8631_06160 [Guyparkeria sp. 1SP6A2]|nr:hypothetical protein [Guyparkeria sp. 1SP6A2]